MNKTAKQPSGSAKTMMHALPLVLIAVAAAGYFIAEAIPSEDNSSISQVEQFINANLSDIEDGWVSDSSTAIIIPDDAAPVILQEANSTAVLDTPDKATVSSFTAGSASASAVGNGQDIRYATAVSPNGKIWIITVSTTNNTQEQISNSWNWVMNQLEFL